MALMTGEQYVESMRKLNLQVYMFGKKVDNVVVQSDSSAVPELGEGYL